MTTISVYARRWNDLRCNAGRCGGRLHMKESKDDRFFEGLWRCDICGVIQDAKVPDADQMYFVYNRWDVF
jgi:transcription elongation factor Elf1